MKTHELITLMLKPYPKHDEDKDWHKMIARWDATVTPTSPTPKAEE